jgi:hypothetical protein
MTVKHFGDKCDSRIIVSQDNVPPRITAWKQQTLIAGFMRRGFPKFQPNTTRIPMGLLLDVFKTCQSLKNIPKQSFRHWCCTGHTLGWYTVRILARLPAILICVVVFVGSSSPILGFYLDSGCGSILTKPYSFTTHKHQAAVLLAA